MQNSQPVTITLTPEEQSILLDALHALDMSSPSPLRALYLKFVFLFQKSGDLCLHSEQSPDAVVQGDSICPKCSSISGVPLPTFQACSECFGLPVQSPDAVGQGGNQ